MRFESPAHCLFIKHRGSHLNRLYFWPGIVLPSCFSLFNYVIGGSQILRFFESNTTFFVLTIGNSLVLQSSQNHTLGMVNIMVRSYLYGNTIIIPIINLNTLFTQPGVFRHKVRCVFIIWIRNWSLRSEIRSICSKCRSVHLAKGKFTRITLNQVSYSACDDISILC